MKCDAVEIFFNNFAQKTKLNIVLALKKKPLSVTELARKIDEEQSKVSHNLKKLAQCNIVKAEQKGKQRIYSLNKNTVLPLLKLMEMHVKSNCRECSR